MLNWNLHKETMLRILKDIYETVDISSSLGFKGGTAAYFFFDLPRYSVDLDFDLLEEKKEKEVFEKLEKILARHGEILEKRIKFYTIFFLISYGKGERNIKIEISRRGSAGDFSVKNYLGISMKVMNEDDAFACKLAALVDRKRTATRDFFDTNYFFSKYFGLNEETLKKKTGKNLLAVLEKAVEIVEKTPDREILQGLGELLTPKQKDWVRKNLKSELIFNLRNYADSLRRTEREKSRDFSDFDKNRN
jgi:predicted nucleotidyltransferase component of viral defense system